MPIDVIFVFAFLFLGGIWVCLGYHCAVCDSMFSFARLPRNGSNRLPCDLEFDDTMKIFLFACVFELIHAPSFFGCICRKYQILYSRGRLYEVMKHCCFPKYRV